LVWSVAGRSVLHAQGFLDVDGQRCEPSPGPVTLWHPLGATDADAWRTLVLERGIAQPFNQVFRETYSEASVDALLSAELDVRTLLGLARSQGWALHHDGVLVRRIGRVRVSLGMGRIYPGASGTTRCGGVQVFDPAGGPARMDDPKLVSECLRAVDLLVSVSAFALAPTIDTATARARQAVLSKLLGDHVDGRSVRVADVSISIATGRATREGAEIEVPPSNSATVLPYPDEILRRIVTAVNHFST
jgi:hypothetical protein